MARSENGRGRRKRKERVVKIKKKKLSQVAMKKAMIFMKILYSFQ